MRIIDVLLKFKSLHRDESGQDLVEYALVLAAVAFAVVAGSTSLASVMANTLGVISTKIASAVTQIS